MLGALVFASCAQLPSPSTVREVEKGQKLRVGVMPGYIVPASDAERVMWRSGDFFTPSIEEVRSFEQALPEALMKHAAPLNAACARSRPPAIWFLREFGRHYLGERVNGRSVLQGRLLREISPHEWEAAFFCIDCGLAEVIIHFDTETREVLTVAYRDFGCG